MPLNSVKFTENRQIYKQRVLFVLIICFMVNVIESAALTTPLSAIAPPSPADEFTTLSVSNRELTNRTEDGYNYTLNPHTGKSLPIKENDTKTLQVSDDLKLSSHGGKSPPEIQTKIPTETNKTGFLEIQTQRPRALEETINAGLLTWSWIGGSTKPFASTPANWKVAEIISQGGSSVKLTTLFPNIYSAHSGNDNTNNDDEYDKEQITNQQSVMQSMNTDLFSKESVSATNVPAIHYSTNFENAEEDSQTSHFGNKEPVKESETGNKSNRNVIGYQVSIHRDNSSSSIYGKRPLFSVQQAEIIVQDEQKNSPGVQIYNQMHPPLLYNDSPNDSHNLKQSNSFDVQQVEKPILSAPPKLEKPTYFSSNNTNGIKYDISSLFSVTPSPPSSSETDEKFVKIDFPHFIGETNVGIGNGSGIADESNSDLPPSVLSDMLKYFNNFYPNSSDTSSESYGGISFGSDPSLSQYLPNQVKFHQSAPEYNQHELDAYTANNSTKLVQETFENFSQLPSHFNVANGSLASNISPPHIDPTTTTVGLSMVNPNVLIKISEQLMDTKRPMLGSSQSLFKNATQSHQPARSEVEDSEDSEIRPTVTYELISSSNDSYETLFRKNNPSLTVLSTTPKYEEYANVPESSQDNSLETALLIKPDPAETDSPVITDQPQEFNGTTEGGLDLTWLPLTSFTEANEIWNATDETQILALNEKSNISENRPSSDVSPSDTNAVLTLHSSSGDLNQTISSNTNIMDDFMSYLLSMDYPIISEQTTLEPLTQKHNISLNFTQNLSDDVLHNSTSFSPIQSLESTLDLSSSPNSTAKESSKVSDLKKLRNNQTALGTEDSEAHFLDTFDQSQSHGSINSWSLLESLVNNSGYTPPTLNIDCEIYGPLSPIVDFYGNLFPGLENPCKNTLAQKEHKGTENKFLVTSSFPNLNSSSEEITATTLAPSTHNMPDNVFASKVNHDNLSSFADFSSDILNKTFASLLDEASSELKNAYPIKHLTMPSETQIEKWWEPLKEITAAPVLENIAGIINGNMPVFNDDPSHQAAMEKHSSDNITRKLPSFTSEQDTETPNASAVTINASNNLPYVVLPNASQSLLFTNILKGIDQELKNIVTTESSLSTALSIVGYKALPTVTMNPGGGSTIIIKSRIPESKPPEVHIPNPVNVFSHVSPTSTSTTPPIKSPSVFWSLFTSPKALRSLSDDEDSVFNQNSSSEAETTEHENESSPIMSREPHSNVTEIPLRNILTTVISSQLEEKGFHLTTPAAEHGSVSVPHNNTSHESVTSSNHSDSSLPKSSSEDIWTSLYQEWLSVSQSNSSKPPIEISTVASLERTPTTAMTNISNFPSHQQTNKYMVTSEKTSEKPDEDTTSDKKVFNTSPSDVIGSNDESSKPHMIETTTEVEFGDVLGSLWDLNAKEVLKAGNSPAVKFPPVRMTISQLPTGIPLYTIDNLTTTSSSSSSSTTDGFSTMAYSVYNKGYTIKDKPTSHFSIEQYGSSHLSSGNRTKNAVASSTHSSDGDILIHSSSEDIPKTGGIVKGAGSLPTGQSEAGKNHYQAVSPIRSLVNKVTDQILSLPKLFTGGQNEKNVPVNPGSQTYSSPESLVTAPGRRPFYNRKHSKSTSFVPDTIYSSAATTSPIPSQIYYPFANESKGNQHLLLGNHRQYHTHEISTSTNRPVIIVKKKGSRIHIPVMPSADFSSFKSHKQTSHSTHSSDIPAMDAKPGNRFAKPQVFSETNRNILTTGLPVWNSNRYKPSVTIESRNKYVATSTPGLALFTRNSMQDDQGLGAAYTTPSLRRKGCGASLLDRLEYLLGRELVMDQIGVGVYSAVVESILAVECNHPSRRPPGEILQEEPLGSITGTSSGMPGTIASTYMAQISPPLPTSSISPTLGMDGWLSLDDIRKDDEKLNLTTTSSPADGFVTNNQLPSNDSLSPIAAFLSAMPPPVPAHKTSESSVNSSTSASSSLVNSPTSHYTTSPLANDRTNSSSMVSSPSTPSNPDIAVSTVTSPSIHNSPVSSDLDLIPMFSPSPKTPLLQSSDVLSTLSPENHTGEVQATSYQPRPSFLHDSHKKLMRRAVGMAALNSLALAKAMPLENEDERSDLKVSSRELTTNIFGFETILTALVYLSFGIFLYQMIQRAVGAKITGLPLDNFIANGGKSLSLDGSSLIDGDRIESYYTLLLRALRKVPNIASKILLEEGKTLEVQAKSPSCLPLYLCRVTSQRYQQKERENATESGSSEHSSIFHHALFTSAVSTLISTWSDQNPSELLMATLTGALGLPCIFEEATCSDKL